MLTVTGKAIGRRKPLFEDFSVPPPEDMGEAPFRQDVPQSQQTPESITGDQRPQILADQVAEQARTQNNLTQSLTQMFTTTAEAVASQVRLSDRIQRQVDDLAKQMVQITSETNRRRERTRAQRGARGG